jgi:competence protein ComEA
MKECKQMKKLQQLHKAEIIILALTLICLVFTAGFFTGKSVSGGVVTVERLIETATPIPEGSGSSASSMPAAVPETSVPETPGVTAETAATPATAAITAVTEKININTASLAELDSLPGIGPVIAGNIIEYRETHGAFTTIDELMDVDGIGQAKFAALKDSITVG